MNKRQKKKKLKQQLQSEQCLNESRNASDKKSEICKTESEVADAQAREEIVEPEEQPYVISLPKKPFWKRIVHYVWFPLAILFMELVMTYSTGGSVTGHQLVLIGLFSTSYGLLLHFIGTITKWEKANFAIQIVLYTLLGILYYVMYLLYCQFQIFYDLNTMFAGAADAISDFAGDVVGLVFTLDGVIHFALFFLPACLWMLLGRKTEIALPIRLKTKGVLLATFLLTLLLNIGCIDLSQKERNLYKDEYNYASAISEFGLLTGMRLEIRNAIFDTKTDVAFETVADEDINEVLDEVEQTDAEKDSTKEAAEETEVNHPTGPNKVEIDFEALATKGDARYTAVDEYVESLRPSLKNEYTGLFEGKNLIFLTAEAFTAEVIDKDLTPTLYRLANKGIQFTDYYQPSGAGTTGGEYCNIFGMLPTASGSSVKKTATHYNWTTLASRLTEKGYYGKAYHNNDYTFYDRDKTHVNLGFSNGYEGVGNGLETIITSQWPESDLEMLAGTLDSYIDKQPFHIYYMTVSGHSLYSTGKNAMSKKHWSQVEDLPYSDPVKAYYACQLELEDALNYLVKQLEEKGIAEDTVIVIGADHFPYGLDQESGSLTYLSELYGKKIENDFVRDHNRLIIWSGCLENAEPIVVRTPTSSMDILPTLCNLFAVEYDSRLLPGRDVFSTAEPLVFTLAYDWKTDKGTYIASRNEFIPSNPKDEVSDEYINRIKTVVKNKINYSKSVLQLDYFRHVFEKEP